MSSKLKIGFMGMSHLGICTSVATAEKGFKIIAFDKNKNKINELNNKKININEPNLNKLFAKNFSKFNFTYNLSDLFLCDIIYISNDVATNIKGKSNLKDVLQYIKMIEKNIDTKTILVILSQVIPGFSRQIKINKNNLYYQVETLIFGQAMNRALYPERIIVGLNDKVSKIQSPYRELLKQFNCPIVKMNYESAELSKLSINMFLISSITTSNVLASLCEKIGCDWNDIIKALKLDKRIGKYAYLKPSLGLAGGNLERDLFNINELLKINKLDHNITNSFIDNSNKQKKWALKIINSFINKNYTISILGLTYKENTNAIKNSQAIFLINNIKNKIKVYDPIIKSLTLKKKIFFCKNIQDCISSSDILIIATPWNQFKRISINKIMKSNIKVVIDPHGLLYSKKKLMKKIEYFTVGNS